MFVADDTNITEMVSLQLQMPEKTWLFKVGHT